jgi:Carboxypeptidase regulatory-like domain
MSALDWITLVLAALAAAIAFGALKRRARRSGTHSPRTVADLVRLRAEQAGAGQPEVAEPQVVEVEPIAEPVAARPEADAKAPLVAVARERKVAVAAVPASADDTPWNRAARIAESDGVVWATDPEWAGWADWADVDDDEPAAPGPERPGPVLRPVVLPAFPPELVDTRTAAAPSGRHAAEAPVEPVVAEPVAAEPVAVDPVVAERVALEIPAVEPAVAEVPSAGGEPDLSAAGPAAAATVRARRDPAETTAEHAAADLALLRTFGCAPPVSEPDEEPSAVALEGVGAPPPTEARVGAAQPVAFHVVGRDGVGVAGAGVTLLDDRGGEAAGAVADARGAGAVLAPRPGSYVLVSAAADHQPGAVAITVAGEPVSADLLLARSASLSGTVRGERGAVVGARLTLVQDGEIVDSAESGPDGGYRIADLAAGEYGLSVSAVECEPVAVMVTVPEETDMRHDVVLDPAGLSRIGLR